MMRFLFANIILFTSATSAVLAAPVGEYSDSPSPAYIASNGYSDSFGDYATASPVPSEMSPPSEKYSAPFVYSAVPVPTPPETPLPSDEYSAPLPSNIGLSDLPTESKGQPDIAYSSCSPDTGDYLKCYDFESQPESSYSAIDESTDNGSMGYNDYGNDYVEPSNADGTINSSGAY